MEIQKVAHPNPKTHQGSGRALPEKRADSRSRRWPVKSPTYRRRPCRRRSENTDGDSFGSVAKLVPTMCDELLRCHRENGRTARSRRLLPPPSTSSRPSLALDELSAFSMRSPPSRDRRSTTALYRPRWRSSDTGKQRAPRRGQARQTQRRQPQQRWATDISTSRPRRRRVDCRRYIWYYKKISLKNCYYLSICISK